MRYNHTGFQKQAKALADSIGDRTVPGIDYAAIRAENARRTRLANSTKLYPTIEV